MSSSEMVIRSTTKDDVKTIFRFIERKAEFDTSMESFSGVIETSEQALLETLFGETPYAHAVLAEAEGTATAFALYYFRYSSFKGRPHLWLDDLLVSPECRGKGIGLKLMSYLASTAVSRNCSHMAWTASTKNIRGVQFYERLGAIVEKSGKGLSFSLSEDSLASLSRTNHLGGIEH